ncbi:hypothetical protein [Microvirga flavescens]|uniref:hypothetical protein n=1 Tax=Microvirga flavescens TaxID=2249811 RepID=UPI0013009CE9|nr:hypothetical protein [Microvirga flavescens]
MNVQTREKSGQYFSVIFSIVEAIQSRFHETALDVKRLSHVRKLRKSTMPTDRDPNIYDKDRYISDPDSRGSNTLAYMIGGLVIALGLLAFLFYGGSNREVTTTGSTTAPSQTAPTVPMPNKPLAPPASPLSPPASPANPTAPQ